MKYHIWREAQYTLNYVLKRSSFGNQNIYSTERYRVWHIFHSEKIGLGIGKVHSWFA